jgi:hypothetical protein
MRFKKWGLQRTYAFYNFLTAIFMISEIDVVKNNLCPTCYWEKWIFLMFLIRNVSNPKGTIRIFQTYLLYWHAKFSFTIDSYHVDSKKTTK